MYQLDDETIDRLDQYLGAHCAPAGGLPDSEALDGFLSAVVAAPSLIMPSEWIESVWGPEHAFEDQQTATEMIGLVMHAYNLVVARIRDPAALTNPSEDLMPLLALPEPDPDDPGSLPDLESRDYPIGALWAYGFRVGRELREMEWEALAEASDELDESLLMIDELMLGLDGDVDLGDGRIADDDLPTLGERLGLLATVPPMLHSLYLDAQEQFAPPALPFRRETPKVGRNDPCPCGSGRKFKHCHGGS